MLSAGGPEGLPAAVGVTRELVARWCCRLVHTICPSVGGREGGGEHMGGVLSRVSRSGCRAEPRTGWLAHTHFFSQPLDTEVRGQGPPGAGLW